MLLYLLLLIPLLTATICLLPLKTKQWETVNIIGALSTGAVSVYCALNVVRLERVERAHQFLVIDGFSSVFVFIIGVVGTISCLYAVNYLRRDLARGEFSEARVGRFYSLLHLFMATMYLAVLADNLGVMWVAIEGTTIASAVLVGFYGNNAALEAAWKYIIICTVGIAFAMLGIIITYYAARGLVQSGGFHLNWHFLYPKAAALDPSLMKLAFVFVLVGYGTKAGLFPLHTWLPDAHSQAPSPVSALLSGVLLNCAVYAIVRFHMLTSAAVGGNFSGRLLIIFGLLSVIGAVPFILVQKDIKRLLAYSSVEHMGIIVLGFGLGGAAGYTGALLHLINHSLGKSALFFSAGALAQEYKSKLINRMQGIGQFLPFTSIIFMASLLAVGGAPPFGLFISELTIASRSFEVYSVLGFVYLMAIAVVFTGLVYFGGRMFFSDLPSRFSKSEIFTVHHLLMLIPVFLLLLQGSYMPEAVRDLITRIVESIVTGGNFNV